MIYAPDDWPPASITVNGVAVKRADVSGKGGWSFVGNTLTTIIPVPSGTVASRVTIEVRRSKGLTARRAELDGFTGAMTRLRAAYDALQTWPPTPAPDSVIDAMQTGDRLSYHPELATEEIAHFHTGMIEAQTSVKKFEEAFRQSIEKNARRISPAEPGLRWFSNLQVRGIGLVYGGQNLQC